MRLSIGGVGVRLSGPAEALRQRFGPFAGEAAGAEIEISVETDELGPYSDNLPLPLAVEGGRLHMPGGWYDPERRQGQLRGVLNVGNVDALVRLALSLALPADGGLLLHGAALTERRLVLVGHSGSGKTTAAGALGADCDELSIVRLEGPRLFATPWWRGRAVDSPLGAVVVLERGGSSVRRLQGAEALRAILARSVRYLHQPEPFAVAAALCRRVPVFEARCPVGAGFLPFLSAQLAEVA